MLEEIPSLSTGQAGELGVLHKEDGGLDIRIFSNQTSHLIEKEPEMKRLTRFVGLVVLGILGFSAAARAQTVQLGIFNSGANLLVKVKPSGDFTSGNQLVDIVFTIRWEDGYGVSLGAVTTSYSIIKAGSEGTSGIYKYQKFAFSGTKVPINWSQNIEYEVLSVPVNQTGSGTGTFELAPAGFVSGGDPSVNIDLLERINSPPFYQQLVSGVPLPIQLASFTASVVRNNDVEIAWKTVSETNNYAFEVQRKRGENGQWTKIAFVEGHGTTLTPQSYTYIDRNVTFGKYYYRIKQIDLDGTSETFPEMEVTVGVGPDKFVLAQNYPNPFNPSTLIEFVVPQNGFATMKVYNLLGQEVGTAFEGNVDAGRIYAARFDASNLPSGLYFYTLRSAGKIETKRMLLLR